MKKFIIIITVLFLQTSCFNFKFDLKIETEKKSVTERFHELLAEQWEKRIVRSPEWASRLGDNRFNNKLNDVSYETILKRQGETKDLLETVKEIDRSKLSVDDQLNYDLYFHGIEKRIEGFQFLSYLMPMDQMGGIQIGFAGISNYMPSHTLDVFQVCMYWP